MKYFQKHLFDPEFSIGNFVRENNRCYYQISINVISPDTTDECQQGGYKMDGELHFINNILFIKYPTYDGSDSLVFIDFNMKEREQRSIIWKFPILCNNCADTIEHFLIMDNIFYSKELNETIYKVRLNGFAPFSNSSMVIYIGMETGIRGIYCSMLDDNFSTTKWQQPDVEKVFFQTGELFEEYCNLKIIEISLK